VAFLHEGRTTNGSQAIVGDDYSDLESPAVYPFPALLDALSLSLQLWTLDDIFEIDNLLALFHVDACLIHAPVSFVDLLGVRLSKNRHQ